MGHSCGRKADVNPKLAEDPDRGRRDGGEGNFWQRAGKRFAKAG
jgi:hypothetical protein